MNLLISFILVFGFSFGGILLGVGLSVWKEAKKKEA